MIKTIRLFWLFIIKGFSDAHEKTYNRNKTKDIGKFKKILCRDTDRGTTAGTHKENKGVLQEGLFLHQRALLAVIFFHSWFYHRWLFFKVVFFNAAFFVSRWWKVVCFNTHGVLKWCGVFLFNHFDKTIPMEYVFRTYY